MQDFNPERQTFYAFAKINLSLEIINKRPDGFHNLSSVMQTIGLYDSIHITPALDLAFDCNLPELVVENNLVWRAALRLLEVAGESNQRGADIYLQKEIPLAAGMGGGSSDAAATLVALNKLWELNLPLTELENLAAELGSDVPFFIRGGTALVEGRGEILTSLPDLQPTPLVLLYPELDLPANKTAQLYKMLDFRNYSNGSVTRALVAAINRGEEPSQSLFYNTFEQVVYERFPQLDFFRQAMVDAGADHVRVSGSGPTLYTVANSQLEAEELTAQLKGSGLAAFAVQTIQPAQR